MQLEQVVGQGDQGPVAPHLLQAAQQKAAESSIFDLAKGRLDDHLAAGVHLGSLRGREFAPHLRLEV